MYADITKNDTSRSTYSLLALVGDIGGLYGFLQPMFAMFLASYTGFNF